MAAAATPLIRNVRFPIGEKTPRYWHGGRRSVSIFFSGLSILFPEGERFFIQSVKKNAHLVKDPALLAQVKAFMGQEGIHGREHDKYNEMLTEQGYSVPRLERETTFLLKVAKRTLYPRAQLAVTAALEHFTAILANYLLRDPSLLEGADPDMAALWRWHAAEESEHKAVAWDVYETAGGHWFERTWVMLVVTGFFLAKIAEHQVVMMRDDGIAGDLEEWRKLLRFMYVEPGKLHLVALEWLQYFRPGFHPNDLDANALLAKWKEDFATLPEYRRAS